MNRSTGKTPRSLPFAHVIHEENVPFDDLERSPVFAGLLAVAGGRKPLGDVVPAG